MSSKLRRLSAGLCVSALAVSLPSAVEVAAADTVLPLALFTGHVTGVNQQGISPMTVPTTGSRACSATPVGVAGQGPFLATVDPVCFDSFLVSGGGYGSLDEAVVEGPISVSVAGQDRVVDTPAPVLDPAFSNQHFGTATGGLQARVSLFDRDFYPCSKITIGVHGQDGSAYTGTIPSDCSAISYRQSVLDDHPTAYWPLDELAGSALVFDISGHEQHATVAAAVTTLGVGSVLADGRTSGLDGGTAARLTGGPGMSRTDAALNSPEFTVEWWQQGMCVDGAGGAVSSGALTVSGVDGSNCATVKLHLTGGDKTLAFGSANALWGFPRYGSEGHHFVVTKSSSAGAALFVDGVAVATDPTATGAPIYGSAPFSMGAAGFNTRYAAGRAVDDVAVYDHPLGVGRVVAQLQAAPWVRYARTYGSEVKYSADAGDPVNTYSGSLTHQKTDVTYPGFVYGMDLGRTYNSADPHWSTAGLGHGWTTSLDVFVRPMADGSLLYHGPEGREGILAKQGANPLWAAPELVQGVVTQTAGTYALQFTSGERWEFDATGVLTRKCQGVANGATQSGWCGTTAGGPSVTVAHGGPGGLPSTVTSSQGFVQRFTYDAAHGNRLSKVVADDNADNVANDPTDRVVDFSYDPVIGSLHAVSAPHFSTDPAYPVEVYDIDDATHLRTKRISVRDVAQADTAAVTIEDSTFDPATGRVVAQTLQSGDAATFAYDDRTNSTTVTYGAGATAETTVYAHDLTGHLLSQQDPNQHQGVNTFDPTSSLVTRTADRGGAAYATAFDQYHRVVQRAIPAATSGFVPFDAGTAPPGDTCVRNADGTFPTPKVGVCANHPNDDFGVETYTYFTGSGAVSGDQRVDTHTDVDGVVTHFDYDTANHPESMTPVKTSVGTGANKLTSFVALSAPASGVVDHVIAAQDGDGVTTCTYFNANGTVSSSLKILIAAQAPVTDATAIASISTTLSATCAAHSADTSANVGRTTYTYTPLGQQATVVTPELQGTGASWSYSYYGFGAEKTATDPLGNTTTTTYAPTGGVATVTGPPTVTDPAGAVTTTAYAWGLPAASCGAAGAGCSRITQTGPSNGKFISGTTGPTVDQITIALTDTAGHLREVDSPAAQTGGVKPVTTFEYGKMGQLTKQTDPDGIVTQNTFDDNGNLHQTIKGTNIGDADATETITYDKLNRPILKVGPKNDATPVTTAFTYTKSGKVLTTTVAPNTADQLVSGNTYDLGNGLLHVSYTIRNDAPHLANTQATIADTYTPGGRVACTDTLVQEAQTSPAVAARHTYQGQFYDDAGRLELSTTPIGAVGSVASCTDHTTAVAQTGRTYYQPDTAYWAVTAHAYRRDDTAAFDQQPTQYLGAHPAQPYQPLTTDVHYRNSYGYDLAGRRTTVANPSPVNPAGPVATETTCFDPTGQISVTIDQLNHPTGYTYRSDGQMASVTDPLGMSYNAGNPCASAPTAGANQKAGQTTFGYDGAGHRLNRRTWKDDLSAQTSDQWTYTPGGRLATTTDPLNHQTGYAYTITAGILVGVTATTGSTTDNSLRKTILTDFKTGQPNTVVANRYDATGTNVTGSYAIGYTYDNAGRNKQIIENPGAAQKVTAFAYNGASKLTTLTYPDTKTAQYQWDLAGEQTQITYPNATNVRLLYDAGERLSVAQLAAFGLWNPVATYARNANGQVTTETLLGSAGNRTWTIDPQSGATTHFNQLVDNTTSDWDIAYQADGRIASDCTGTAATCATTPLPSAAVKTAYSYDNAGQLTQAARTNAPAGTVNRWTYAYGNHGNRTQQTGTIGTTTTTTNYVHDDAVELCATKVGATPSSCTDASATRYSYDFAGRRTAVTPPSGPATVFAYDPRGKPSTIAEPDNANTVTETRTYDALGNLSTDTATEAGLGTHNSTVYWDLSGREPVPQPLEWVRDGYDFRYDYGADRVDGSGTWFSYDYRQSNLGTSQSKAPTGYDPYGAPAPAFGAMVTNTWSYLGYRGELQLGPTLDLRARDYDAATGTFTTRDPLDGVAGTTTVANPYAYVYNSPNNGTDPNGERPTVSGFNCPAGYNQGAERFQCDPTPETVKKQQRAQALENVRHRNDDLQSCKSAGGVNWDASGPRCFLPPANHNEGGQCFPPLVHGRAIIYNRSENSCGSWAVTVECARGDWVPGLNWFCQNGNKIKFGAEVVLALSLVVASAGTLGPAVLDLISLCAPAALVCLQGALGIETGAAATGAGAEGAVLAENAPAIEADVQGELEAAQSEIAAGEGEGSGANPLCPTPSSSSFDAATPVVMANGTRIPISQVKVGDKVLAADPATGKTEAKTVTAVMDHDDTDLMDVTVKGADGHEGVLRTNAHHIFWDDSKHEWLRVDQLQVGDRLVTSDGVGAEVGAVTVVPGHQRMWDLSVDDVHSFYVDSGHGAVLVHNDDDAGRRAEALRREWERETGKPWPKDANGRNYDVSHVEPKADGGYDGYPNTEPMEHDAHMQMHKDNGDFKRWGQRSGCP